MLVLKKNYELREIREEKILLLTVLVALLVWGIGNGLAVVPDGYALALGIPIGILTSWIWELFVDKSNIIFTKEGIAWFLTKIKEREEGTVKEFSKKYLKVRGRNKYARTLDDKAILDEVLLLCHLLLSSCLEEVNQEDPQKVKELFVKIRAKGSVLEKEFGISFANLCWLYHSNICYRYNYHGQGTSVPFEVDLRNQKLQIQKRLSELVLIDEEFYVKEDTYKGHELMERYKTLSKTVLYSLADSTTDVNLSNELILETGSSLLRFFEEVKDRHELRVMAIQVCWDLICLLSFCNDWGINMEGWLGKEGIQDIKKMESSLFAYLHTHPVLDFLVKSRGDFGYFKQYAAGYAFSEQCRNTFISHIYKNELMRTIKGLDEHGFVIVYEERKRVLGDTRRITNFDRLIERFYWNFKYGQPLRFEDIDFDYSHLKGELQEVDRAYYRKRQKLLSDMEAMETAEEKKQVLKWIFQPYYCLTWFKTTPIYIFQPFQKFAEYLMDEK